MNVLSRINGFQWHAVLVVHIQNGLTVCTWEISGPVAGLVFAFRAGARYEQPDEKGLAHHLRNAIGIDSEDAFGVQLRWQCGSAGTVVVPHLTRDLLAVQASVIREHAGYTLPLLREFIQPAFKPWDIENVPKTVKTDIAHLEPKDRLMDLIHYAAFRTEPLGNFLHADEEAVGKIDFKKLSAFAKSRMVSGQAVLVGINIGHDDVMEFIETDMTMFEQAGKQGPASRYFGGEVRFPFSSSLAHVAIAGEGASLQNAKARAIQLVLLSAFVSTPSVKYGQVNEGVVARAVYKASSGYPFGLSVINEAYWDTGLFGVYLCADADKIAPLIHAAIDALKNFSIDEAGLQYAKNAAKMNILSHSANTSYIALDYATQLLATNAVSSFSEMAENIQNVTKDDLEKAASIMSSKLSLASCGNIYQIPYLDQL